MDNITAKTEKRTQWILLLSVLIIATCGLIYELVAGTLASYLLGDSVTQFSLIIGIYLFSMGIGSFLSKYVEEKLLEWFIRIEILVGLVGGFSAPILFTVFPLTSNFHIILYALVVIVGTLVGVEIPILLKILKDKLSFTDLVSRVFTFDYIGALLASIIFPLLFVPHFGLIRTSLFFGIFNVLIGIYLSFYFAPQIKKAISLKVFGVIVLIFEVITFVFANDILDYSDHLSYNDNVIFSKTTPYQRMVITRNKKELRLFLNSNLQFSSLDEYRYHEALVHPALSNLKEPKSVLVLGGGDGLAIREVLKYPSIEHIHLVDLDPEMTRMFTQNDLLASLNEHSFSNPKVKITNADAFIWLKTNTEKFDCVIVDFPDPSSFGVGKLYTTAFYNLVKNALHNQSIMVIQSTSPLVAPKSFWCVNKTLESVGFHTTPYHNFVPSFGEWGYIMAMTDHQFVIPDTIAVPLKFLSSTVLSQMLTFSNDMKTNYNNLEVNKLNNQVLVKYFDEEWSNYIDR